MVNKNTYIFFVWTILFSLLFVTFFIPLHIPFSGDNDLRITSYLISGNGISNLTENEVSHMKNVRLLFIIATALFFALSAILLADPKIDKKKLVKELYWFDGIMFLCLIFFNLFFKLFHLILFPQGNWLFPTNSILIQTYPQSFFVWMFVFFILIVNLVTLTLRYGKFVKK